MHIRLALDRYPTTIHAGLFLASILDFYKDEGVTVEFISTHQTPIEEINPIERLFTDEADLIICSAEEVIAYQNRAHANDIKAIATLTQNNQRTFLAHTAEKCTDVKTAFEDSIFLSSANLFEKHLLNFCLHKAGLNKDIAVLNVPKEDMWRRFVEEPNYSLYSFSYWDSIEAKLLGLNTYELDPHQFGLPLIYSSLIISESHNVINRSAAFKAFLRAVHKGYKFAVDSPDEAAKILMSYHQHPIFENGDLIKTSLNFLSNHFLDADKSWGKMQLNKWQAFSKWFEENKILKHESEAIVKLAPAEILFTNTLFEDF